MPMYREEVEKTVGLELYSRKTILSPRRILTVAIYSKTHGWLQFRFFKCWRQTGIPTSGIPTKQLVKKLWKTHYKILLSAAPLSPWEILLDARVCYHSFTTATYLTMPIPLASSEFNCFSLHCWGSCTWRSQQPDTSSPCSVCRCDCQSPWVMGHKCHITT